MINDEGNKEQVSNENLEDLLDNKNFSLLDKFDISETDEEKKEVVKGALIAFLTKNKE